METHGTTVEEHRTMEAIQSINQKIQEIELRDLFAMAALNGILSDTESLGPYDQQSEIAYKYADAMLKARRAK